MLADSLTGHDGRWFIIALICSLIGSHLAFLLLPRDAASGDRRSLARTITAGVALGGTAWIVFRLSLAAVLPVLPPVISWPTMAAGLSLALVGAIAVTVLIAYGARSARNTVLAASTLCGSVSCMLVVSVGGFDAPMVLGYNLVGVLAAMLAGTAVSGFGLQQLGRAASRRDTWLPVSLVALALALVAVATLMSIEPVRRLGHCQRTVGHVGIVAGDCGVRCRSHRRAVAGTGGHGGGPPGRGAPRTRCCNS